MPAKTRANRLKAKDGKWKAMDAKADRHAKSFIFFVEGGRNVSCK
jgi:hypothetical protein